MALARLYFKETEKCRYTKDAAGAESGFFRAIDVRVKKRDIKNTIGSSGTGEANSFMIVQNGSEPEQTQ